jgi:vitamin B12 transporter
MNVRHAPGLGLALLLTTTAPGALAQTAVAPDAPTVSALDQVVVTATARPETRDRITGTIQVIDQSVIARSTAKSLTDLVAENSMAFLSEWTPAQTSINIRGGASDGQGRDFLGDVLVLVNGRRAGTSNLSKLSSRDVERVEVVRGPSSVIYGSQNIGGVVNIITARGKGRDIGGVLDADYGSWDYRLGHAAFSGEKGKFDWYLGGTLSARGDYHSGKGGSKMQSTQYERRGFLAEAGYQINDLHRIEANYRSDGTFNAGFRGSGSNIVSKEDRYNQSADINYSGGLSDRFTWTGHGYWVRDIDHLRWASPVLRAGNNPTSGTSKDWNKRRQEITGLQIRPQLKLFEGNTLLGGFDYEVGKLRSTRYREAMPGAVPLAQIAPLDNNQTDKSHAFYFEDAQDLLGDKLTLRGGVRRTDGSMRFDATPNLVRQVVRTVDYGRTTYSVGAVYRPVTGLALRAGYSTGFRVPTATQLAGEITALGGAVTLGNPNLTPQNGEQIEIGGFYATPVWSLDAALFQNIIHDRIVSRAINPTTSTLINNPADIFVQGLELQGTLDALRAFGADAGPWRLNLRAQGYYNFQMKDKGAAVTANTRRAQRMYLYESSFSAVLGQDRTGFIARPWSLELMGVLRGPVWYDTEENLLIPTYEPNNTFIHRKEAFWVFNLRGSVDVSERITLSGAVNNLFNVNQHPLFIAIDKAPYKADPRFQNGGRGTSMPGREFVARIQARF